MNVLAHLMLAEDCPAARLGQLLGDHARGPVEDLPYPPEIRRGIRRHRSIDTYTDQHPINRSLSALLRPGMPRYAPILIDLYHDHFLARHFPTFAHETLRAFADRCYDEWAKPVVPVPGSLAGFIEAMRTYDILGSYREPEGIHEALRRIGLRTRHGTDLATPGLRLLETHHDRIEADFLHFFPELQHHVTTLP